MASSSSSSRSSVAPSSFLTYRPTFQPQCTHLTVTRMYDPNYLYALEKGHRVSFDHLGTVFGDEIRPGLRGPERRSNKLSFFEEITAEQMQTYSPLQIATILDQREFLLNHLKHEHLLSGRAQQLYYLPSGSHGGQPLRPPPGFDYTKPWVSRLNEECQAKFCHRCRPSFELRSYLSLDGILNGDVPPTAATGFGFHRIMTRPVMDARVVRDIGLRPVPWPRAQSHTFPSSPSSESAWSLSEGFEDRVIEPVYAESGQLLVLEEGSITDSVIPTPSRAGAFEVPRPAWSPPSTPTSWTGIVQLGNDTTMFEHCPFVCDGRSPNSLRTNDPLRHQVIESIAGLMDQELDEYEIEEFRSICSPASSDEYRLIRSSLTSVTSPNSDDGRQKTATPMMEEEQQEGRFHEEPLDVGNGIAVLEESVELRVPDVIAQM
ncbi:hypothetical protein HD806DRAFT_529003 [Xylariaceae sp. AK1471]|nr:hypothetical protein HD806DRAFT_529003 [Xylariaceae sp. AK1471]